MTSWQVLRVRCGGSSPTPLPELPGPALLVFPADAQGEALAGAVAAQTGAAILGRISGYRIDGPDLFAKRSTHGGRLALELRLASGLCLATSNNEALAQAEIELGSPAGLQLERSAIEGQQVSLESARIVIGGGRGLDAESFSQLDQIAGLVEGAVGASLAAVDLGLAPVSRQVGQSGKFVNPAIYFAAGLSGTPQHFAGVGAKARIVAINPDPEAPVFSFASAGVVGDAKKLLPLIADSLAELKAAAA